jgi:hypothetical protein
MYGEGRVDVPFILSINKEIIIGKVVPQHTYGGAGGR